MAAVALITLTSCKVTSLESERAAAPAVVSWEDLPAKIKARTAFVQLEKIHSADWSVDRSGLIDLEHQTARSAGLSEGPEPIQIFLFSLVHPRAGRYFIDTGIAEIFKGQQEEWPVSSVIRGAMNMEALQIKKTTAEVLQKGAVAGVFLTHMHLDHILGGADILPEIPFLVGPGESTSRHWQNMVVQGSTDRLLGKNRPLRELGFESTAGGLAVSDYFGDGSFFVIHVPGHTPGSLAFLAVTTDGVHLMTGDTCHTAWGWKNNVTPGTFTRDKAANALALNKLKELTEQLPGIQVHPGHQNL
ncbi:MAG: MBL fold metallo-hydrolase [Spirochaetales bacterium]|nr:MBL fold metallo-hydrolase [Spirochaetales bacterium]